jgi:hypothetical protein
LLEAGIYTTPGDGASTKHRELDGNPDRQQRGHGNQRLDEAEQSGIHAFPPFMHRVGAVEALSPYPCLSETA